MQSLKQVSGGADAAVIGASGGIGGAIARLLVTRDGIDRVFAFGRSGAVPDGARVIPGTLDLTDEASIREAAGVAGQRGKLRLVIVATGLLHDGTYQPEKSWRQLTPEGLARAFAVNATGPALVARHFLPVVPRDGRSILAVLSARVGSISDNRAGGWYGYRASKAALNQILRCVAIEEARRRPGLVAVGLQPGTVRTALSAPFRASARDVREPEDAASRLLDVLDRLGPSASGRVFDWRGDEVPP